MIVESVSNEWTRISDNFRPKGQGIQFTIYLGKSFMNVSSNQHTLLRRFLKQENKNFTCEKRQIYTVNLKINTVIAIGHEMIFVYTVSTKLSSTS